MQKSGGMVLIVGDNVGCSLQSSGLPNKETAQKYPDNLKCQECGHIYCLFGPFKQHYGI